MDLIKEKRKKRLRRHKRIRRKVCGTSDRPRLSVFKSLKNIYCQIIDDIEGRTLLSVSTLSPTVKSSINYGGNKKAAEIVGEKLAEEAKKKGIKKVVFDRGGYLYHGRIKALAECARKNSLDF